jgi:hypothetical protein
VPIVSSTALTSMVAFPPASHDDVPPEDSIICLTCCVGSAHQPPTSPLRPPRGQRQAQGSAGPSRCAATRPHPALRTWAERAGRRVGRGDAMRAPGGVPLPLISKSFCAVRA